jgi:hypothetical protein
MANKGVPFKFSLILIEPAERLMAIARKWRDSPDENRRCVTKALLDVTDLGRVIADNMMNDRNTDLAPYLDFWFADAVACAENLSKYEDAESRDLAQCLIDSEKSLIKSKERVLAEINRLGIRPSGG